MKSWKVLFKVYSTSPEPTAKSDATIKQKSKKSNKKQIIYYSMSCNINYVYIRYTRI